MKPDQNSNKDKPITYNNYYINSKNKENQQNCHSKFFSLISKHTFNILYGILGSIVASALSGAVYSIVNSTKDENSQMEHNFTTTTNITDIIIEISTKPTDTFTSYSQATNLTSNPGTGISV